MRRGDNIPSVSEYAHWNEDAEAVWFAENRYDMEHADEEIEDDDRYDGFEPECDIEETFFSEAEARAFYDAHSATAQSLRLRHVRDDVWEVDGYSEGFEKKWKARVAAYRKQQRRRN